MTRDAWLDAHPYLQPVARFCAQVDAAVAELELAGAGIPRWDDYAPDFHEGVPLLQSFDAAIDLEPAGVAIASLVAKLASGSLADRQAAEARLLAGELRGDGESARHVVAWLLGDDAISPVSPGLLRFLGWTVMARYLHPVVRAFEGWRQEEQWLRGHCPTCGSRPAMAQLVGVDPGRMRFLSCGRCRTRWRFGRTACPFCGEDAQRLAIVAIEGEAHLRIDHCESCRGYLKTYVGQGDEPVFLADWTSLHLDLLARDRGLERLAASLYELEPEPFERAT